MSEDLHDKGEDSARSPRRNPSSEDNSNSSRRPSNDDTRRSSSSSVSETERLRREVEELRSSVNGALLDERDQLQGEFTNIRRRTKHTPK